ncbi:MarR family transcriptional regulator [Diaphorobacter ruginosibacter]|uniref:MarR family winged helix-turn-helix transcriptional regulator n=1 Tax=Diaphorobacter ruginosibacter TaxID=1715720 RepID=UPI00334214B1
MNADTLSTQLLDALHDLTHAYRSRMRSAMHSLEPGVTPNELRMLIFLGRTPQCTHKSMMDHMHADKAQIARTLNLLEERGWIVRAPNPQDKRSRVLELSESGAARVAALREERAAIGNEMLGCMAAGDQQKMLLNLLAMKNRLLGQTHPV